MLAGYKTLLWAMIMAGFPTVSTWLAGIDWVAFLTAHGVSQAWVVPLAGLIGGIVTAVLRFATSTPVFNKQ